MKGRTLGCHSFTPAYLPSTHELYMLINCCLFSSWQPDFYCSVPSQELRREEDFFFFLLLKVNHLEITPNSSMHQYITHQGLEYGGINVIIRINVIIHVCVCAHARVCVYKHFYTIV